MGKRIKHLESESTTRMRRQERQYKSYVYEHLFDPFKHQLEICHHPEWNLVDILIFFGEKNFDVVHRNEEKFAQTAKFVLQKRQSPTSLLSFKQN